MPLIYTGARIVRIGRCETLRICNASSERSGHIRAGSRGAEAWQRLSAAFGFAKWRRARDPRCPRLEIAAWEW
ncbi:hypothetical protein [Burkholderia territorii]|uniref:hypothetical protein n=1 Tax=Burkholderia territorii TaxID=1503055 RepID=UPI0012DA395B|nr:hypothetical protein [Burkholderia territorii]